MSATDERPIIGPRAGPAARSRSGITTIITPCRGEKYPNCTDSVWGTTPSPAPMKSETTSVLSSDSLIRRTLVGGYTCSMRRWPASVKWTTSSAGASARRTARSRCSAYMGNIGRSRTSLKDSANW